MIDSSNKFLVSTNARGQVVIGHLPPGRPLDRDDALLLAAWLVAIADRRPGRPDSDFGPVLKAILEN